MTTNEYPAPDAVDARYVGTYTWTDAHGEEGRLDIHAAPQAQPPVQARTPVEGEIVAAVDSKGHPGWSAQRLRETGLDTAAARNDLIEVVRQTYLGLPASR